MKLRACIVCQELHHELFGLDAAESHVVKNFSNPYGIRPNFKNYPHSNLLPQFFTDILDILQLEGMPRFIVEVGSLHGHSAIQMATVLDKLGMTRIPILCIDPFTGDTNMWASYQQDKSVGGWVNIIDGRMTIFDQFMANVQFAVNRSVSPHHILPFQATSTVGARWLAAKGLSPDLIFLDSAHEADETFLELSMYFELLQPGGILFGDDYGWPAVKKDVDRFAAEHNSEHGADNPLDLRIARAQAGATNLIWIMRKAKRDLPAEKKAVGAGAVRRFWATFAAVDRDALAMLGGDRTLLYGHWRLLEENWLEAGREEEEVCTSASGLNCAGPKRQGTEVLVKSREAAAAAKASEQWKVLLAALPRVQHLIGRPSSEKVPGWKDMQQELHRKRERLLEQAPFLLVPTSNCHGGCWQFNVSFRRNGGAEGWSRDGPGMVPGWTPETWVSGMAESASFCGGPEPVNGLVRVHLEEDLMNPRFKPLPPERDEEWHELIRCGGGGEVPDTPLQQAARYQTENPNSPETHPGLEEHCVAKPDVVITSSMDYLIRTWDVKKGFKMHQEFTGHLNFVNQVLPYRGDKILSCSDDYTCRLWQIGEAGTEGELLFTYWINMYPMKAVCALPGQRAGVGGLDKTVRIFSLVTGCTLFRMTDHRDFGPDRNFFQKEGCGIIWCMLHLRNNIIASGSDDCTVRLWDIDQGKCLCTQIGHKGYGEDIGEPGLGWKLAERFATVIRMCHLGKDGQQFASCSYDRTITIWDATTPTDLQVLRNFKAHGNGIVGLGIAGKQHLVSCSGDKTVKVWNFETGELEREIPTRGIASDACMIDDGTIFIAGGDATIRIYNWREDKEVKQFYAHDLTLQFCAPVFLAQKDPRNWTEVPIMYQNITYPENEADSKCALEQMRKILYNALNYAEIS
ncbi:unnamed protein product [Effrenium voratum]|nr:unnamed protein product [Effrenium voratum]